MTQRGPFLFLVAVLAVLGIATAAYRHDAFRIPILPGTQQAVWQVEARVEYRALGTATQALLTLPPDQTGFRVVNESSASPGFGFDIATDAEQRRAHWTKRSASGEQILYYKLDLVEDPGYSVVEKEPGPVERPLWDEPYETAALQVLQGRMPLSADAPSLAALLVQEMGQPSIDQNLSLLLDRYPPSELLATLLRTAGYPARTVQVLELEDGRRRQDLTEFVQVWQDGRWRLVDPARGVINDARGLLLWQTATPGVLEVMGGTRSNVTFSMISQTRPATSLLVDQAPGFDISLYGLPIAEQGVFKLIMLLPVGALVVVLMRILVGIKTSGTFMPVLIALAFLQTQLLPGLASFLLVTSIGLMIRSYLSALNLLLVARIATLVIVVIGIMTVFSVLSYQFGFNAGLTITFFPMIILAWTIERLSILWEEQGPKEVLVQGGGSLFVATLAFLIMDQTLVRHLAFNFPELHLCVLALILLLGRYTGYRLMELRRFAAFDDR
ncbi:MAG: UUP1 family membrane protein [Pseudomonadales bacterium]